MQTGTPRSRNTFAAFAQDPLVRFETPPGLQFFRRQTIQTLFQGLEQPSPRSGVSVEAMNATPLIESVLHGKALL